MKNFDYTLNVYYNEEYVCTLVANHAGCYDNVIWWQLNELIQKYKDNEISEKIFDETLKIHSEYFELYKGDQLMTTKKIDFSKKIISLPTCPIYTMKQFEECWGDVAKIKKEENEYFIIYEESNKYLLSKVKFDETKLTKETVSFKEFVEIYNFYEKLIEKDNEYILNDSKILKFNII